MYDMINIFEVFLPQLLRYPNPTDPLNGEAAALLMREPKSYDAKVKGTYSIKVPVNAGQELKNKQSMYKSTLAKILPRTLTRMMAMMTR